MSVNNMTFEQMATVLTSITQQATGQAVETPTNTGSFVSVAQRALNSGFDAVMNAISNVLARTIFAIRPYSASFTGLDFDSFRWGNVMRKLSVVEDDWQDDPAFDYPVTYDASQTPPDGRGGSVDPWKIKKPNVVQTLFTGQSVYFDELTITQRQLETAFSGPDEFGSFFSMLMTNLNNRLERSNENIRRGLVANMIGAIYDENQADRVVKLLTMYNNQTGLSLTPISVYHPDNFPAFVKWAYAAIEDFSDMFTKPGIQFQTTLTGEPIIRHTPKEYQRVYLYSKFMREISSRVLADTYHDTFLRLSDVEAVPFWQSQDSRDSVSVFPAYTSTAGQLIHKTASGDEVEVDNILGVMFDRDMMGMTMLDRQVLSTSLNTRGLYYNLHVHCNQRVFFDNMEKGVIFLLA